MTDDRDRQIELLEQRISSLSAAILRINESLDLPTVLNEVVECACALTTASRGAIATLDASGAVLEYVSTGFTDEEHRSLTEWSGRAPAVRAHARPRDVLAGGRPRRLGARSSASIPSILPHVAVMGTPLLHRGRHVGNFFVGDKDSGEAFTGADQEILALFASQAATAIANARTHRSEQRARADLEALVDTSPVGVVVFDAVTGTPLSLNREARRIVESLRTPGLPTENTCSKRSPAGLPTAARSTSTSSRWQHELSRAATMRAEEVALSLPDGRQVSALVNVTPDPFRRRCRGDGRGDASGPWFAR